MASHQGHPGWLIQWRVQNKDHWQLMLKEVNRDYHWSWLMMMVIDHGHSHYQSQQSSQPPTTVVVNVKVTRCFSCGASMLSECEFHWSSCSSNIDAMCELALPQWKAKPTPKWRRHHQISAAFSPNAFDDGLASPQRCLSSGPVYGQSHMRSGLNGD